MITYGSVCSGIEAASVAWEPLGMRPAWFSEVDAAPCSLLAHYWPKVVNIGDMRGVAACVRAGLVPAPDVLVGGTPCQAFSLAGLRAGMADARGALTLTYVDVLNAVDEKRPIGNEAACVWENVPGVLTSKDNAFGCFLAALCGEDEELKPPGQKWANAGCVFGPQRNVAWRVLDAQYFGVAQRRRRVFVVASARNNFDPCQVLFESEGLRRDTAPSRKTRQAPASGATASAASSCGAVAVRTSQTSSNGWGVNPDGTAYTLDCSGVQAVAYRQLGFGAYAEDSLAGTIKARDYKSATDLVCADVVRRLTPLECERLQGFPDGYTAVPHRRSVLSDSARYKALGNSKAVPVVRWVGRRLKRELQA